MASKKDKDAAFNDFLADLKAINPQIEELIKDEKVSAKLREGVLARADYSSNMDQLRSERELFEQQVNEARDRIAGWQKWYGDVSQQVATAEDKLKQYETLYGSIDDVTDQRRAAKVMGISKEELSTVLEEREKVRDVASLKFADDLTDIKIDYDKKFGGKLDTAAVFEIAGKRGVDLLTAYDLHIADRVEEKRTKDMDERIKREREDAVKEYASKHNLPVVPTNSDIVHVLDAKDIPNNSRDRIAAAVASMRGQR